MDIALIIGLAAFLTIVFVCSQALIIFALMKENERLRELAEKNSPPF